VFAIRVLSFIADGEAYAIDTGRVLKLMRGMEATPVPAAPEEVIGIANMHGSVITLLDLRAMFTGRRDAAPAYGAGALSAIVVKAPEGAGDVGIIIDSPGDLLELEDGDISPPPLAEGAGALPYVSGVAAIGNALYRILDIDAIINRFMEGEHNGQVS
jgi:purine-binding chemotaxis protein CheW